MSVLTADHPAALAAQRHRWPQLSALMLINCVALFAVTTFLRSWRLENIPGVNGDEAWSGVQALKLLRGGAIEWRTPSGNPVNPFFLLPLAALHVFLPPSFVLLRITPLVSGLVALVANYCLCRRAFDARTATISTILLAALPIDIAYSRFAWDASQSLLATLLVLYLPLIHERKPVAESAWPVMAVVVYAAAIVVHPTNVFAAPLLVVPVLCRRRGQIARILHSARNSAAKGRCVAILATSAVASYFAWPWIVALVRRLSAPEELSGFAVNYLRLFSGTTVYEFLSGAPQADCWAGLGVAGDFVFGCAALLALLGMYRQLHDEPTLIDSCVVIGWFVMLVCFYLVAGAGAITPHFERYGICLIAPGALIISRGLAWWIDPWRPRAKFSMAALAIAVWFWPISFYVNYFEFIEQTGGRSHRTFQTAAVEPKLAALRYVLAEHGSAEPARIFCSEWWNYWPLEYLALGAENVRVLRWDPRRCATRALTHRLAENTWFVEFSGSAAEADVVRRCEAAGLTAERHSICDYSGRPAISVIRPVEKFSWNY